MGGPNTVQKCELDPLVLPIGLIFLCSETGIIQSYFRLYCESHAPAFMSGLMVLVVAHHPRTASGRDKFRAVDTDPVSTLAKSPTLGVLLEIARTFFERPPLYVVKTRPL